MENADLEKIKDIFEYEYPKAENFYRKNKKLMFKIRQLEYEKKINITKQISIEDYNRALNEWDRVEITVGKEKKEDYT